MIVEQLIQFHKNEPWHTNSISDEELARYFEAVIAKGRILFYMDEDRVIGYCESWRINFEQLGRILCGEVFSASAEDINTGNIAYVANVHILPEYRDGEVYKNLRLQFFKQNFMCTHFVGEARRKKSEPFKCFKRREIMDKYFKEGVMTNGQ